MTEKKHKVQMSEGRTNRGDDKHAHYVPTTLSLQKWECNLLQVVV